MQGERTLLDRYIRAGSIVWLMMLFTIAMLSDGNIEGFSIKTEYVTGLISLMTVVMPTYLAVKTIDKWKASNDTTNVS